MVGELGRSLMTEHRHISVALQPYYLARFKGQSKNMLIDCFIFDRLWLLQNYVTNLEYDHCAICQFLVSA